MYLHVADFGGSLMTRVASELITPDDLERIVPSHKQVEAEVTASPYDESRMVLRVWLDGTARVVSMAARPERAREFSSLDAAWSLAQKLGINHLKIENQKLAGKVA
jgi:hypothetical protein